MADLALDLSRDLSSKPLPALTQCLDGLLRRAAELPESVSVVRTGHPQALDLFGQGTGASVDVLRHGRQALLQLGTEGQTLARGRIPQRSQSGLKGGEAFADLLDDAIERSLLDHLPLDRVSEETIDACLPAFRLVLVFAEQRFFRHGSPTDYVLSGE